MTELCTGFEPQNYLRERCKKCFRPKEKHAEESMSTPTSKKERRKSWRERNVDNGAPDDEDTEQLSVSSYLSATSKGLSSAKSLESINDTKSMVTAVSGSIGEEERAITPTENDQSYMHSLKDEITNLRDMNRSLKDEMAQYSLRQRLNNLDASESSLLVMLEERLNHAENQIQDYRDENTVLKCELRELQESTYATSDDSLKEKIKATESLCDELMEENEQLKADVKDLQQEIEEMQDQYREEEIEEFRELQRELEQNAKNCRVLQFKLRKTERQKEQAEAEKVHAQSKHDELVARGPEGLSTLRTDSSRVKELESEVRIAKEVSVRLHNELEQTEERRCRLEDEVFHLKEKVREIQTQNKWREARNKADYAVKRLSAELAVSAPGNDSEMNKELRDALEREIDLREQLRFSEEDLKRTQLRLQDVECENEELVKKLSKACKMRPPMIRSASEGNAHLQLELAESQVQHLNTKVERLEKTNGHLSKKIVELETDYMKHGAATLAPSKGGEFKMTPEMEKDMSKMIATISDLERRNLELTVQLKQLESKNLKPAFAPTAGATTLELRSEQEKRRALEVTIAELKSTVFKSDNQKIIALAAKIEQLNVQLQLVTERCNSLHKKNLKDTTSSQYADDLKTRIEQLEKQLCEHKAAEIVNDLQGGNIPTVDEVEQCCEVLASIELQTSRLCKQFEKIDHAQKDERRRSLSKDSGATIIAELANVMQELKSVNKMLDKIKCCKPGTTPRRSPNKELLEPKECDKCGKLEQVIEEQQNEIGFYKKKNKDLTNQVLQTEDRWTIEIEKQRQIFEREIKTLGIRISDTKRLNEEQHELLESKSATLIEKSRTLEEQEEKSKKLLAEVEAQRKEIQELEAEHKSVREFEIKYKKLESIFDIEREKMNTERSRAKNELTAMKKIKDDTEDHLKKISDDQKKNESAWKLEKAMFEREVALLKEQLPDDPSNSTSAASKQPSKTSDSSSLHRQDSDKHRVLELKKQIAMLEKKIADSGNQLEDVKIANAELKDQLTKAQQGWQKDKEAFQHKSRQTEKIRTVEIDAMQQKFSSRMRIMEDTNKSLHSQLVLARRERDSHKEALANFEKQVTDEKSTLRTQEKSATESVEKMKDLQNRLAAKEEELERLNTDLRLTKEARKADQILWNIDRARVRSDKGTEDPNGLEMVRRQYRDCEAFYSKEVERLKDKIAELTAGSFKQRNEATNTIRELKEQIRVMEIEKKNLFQNKDTQQVAREMIESERERLQQLVHLNELQKLTRKYRLSSIIDQLQYVSETTRRTSRDEPDGFRYIINQLLALREDEAANNLNADDRCGSVLGERVSNGYAGSMSECGEGTYDNISQSSFSMRSLNSVRGNFRLLNHAAAMTATVSQTISENEPVYSKVDKIGAQTLPFQTKRSFSTDTANGFDRYGRPIKKYQEQSSSNLNVPSSRKTSIEDESFRVPRTASFDNRSQFSEDDQDSLHPRTNSTGTNILYRIRREELARGGQPSVRLMAKAFESIDEPKSEKRGFFGIRKSRSVETTPKQGRIEEAANSALMHSLSQVNEGVTSNYATLPRGDSGERSGGRNPFKNMGSRLVERVRRSISRSSRQSRESDKEEEIEVTVMKKVPEKPQSSPKKTKKKSAESKARKGGTNLFSS